LFEKNEGKKGPNWVPNQIWFQKTGERKRGGGTSTIRKKLNHEGSETEKTKGKKKLSGSGRVGPMVTKKKVINGRRLWGRKTLSKGGGGVDRKLHRDGKKVLSGHKQNH